MAVRDSVVATVDVSVGPAEAFEIFTAEIDSWYHVDRHTVLDHTRTKAIRFETGVGGRLLDVHDERTGEGREMGRVTSWEPGRRLVFVDLRHTEVEVTFAPHGDGTRVTLEHRGLSRLAPQDPARRYGWWIVLPWYASTIDTPRPLRREPAMTASFTAITPYLYYADAGAALDWLTEKLGFGPDSRSVGADGNVDEAEIQVGAAKVMMTGHGPKDSEGAGALLIVHVDDVDAQYDRMRSAGVEVAPPKDEAYGPRTINVTDPWGYRWYFWQGEADYGAS